MPRQRTRLFALVLLAMGGPTAVAALFPSQDDGPAPALELPDLGGTQHGLGDYRGKVVLVNFWATWCAPCIIEMPGMQRLLSDMKQRPFTILAVNVSEPEGKVWRFKNMLKVNFTTLLDSDGAVSEAWDVQVYPTSYLIDSTGHIRYTAYGMIDWDSDETRGLIEQLMPDQPAK